MRRAASGFSLIELMVGITIALIVSLAIFSVLSASENRKRVTTAVNDINQSGAYSAYLLDRQIRSAGSGITNQWYTLRLRADIEGCVLQVQRGGTALLPSALAFPAPFAAMPQNPRLIPLIIDPGAGTASDVITVMAGSQGRSESGARVIGPSPTGVSLVNTLGFTANDLVLFAHNADEGNCQISQVASTFTPIATLPTTDPALQDMALGGTYVHASGADFSANLALGLGNATTNRPQFKMFGVSAENQLVEYDLLNLDGTATPQPLADGVVRIKAVYGVDTNGDGVINEWVTPTGAYAPAALRAGTAAAAASIRQIVAVRLALILRTSLPEKDAVQASRSFTLFNGLTPAATGANAVTPLPVNFNATGDDRFRYRLIETTIPLRNNLL